ncbi:hypothetical protein PIB30_006961 [Stylosanthes scabra]|uniref:Uncharacterized protein n=1 Tax=Stylosanthes scabra TaxID=79078 RepID=A0ABU6Y1L9_9FABA|nr:hypothetical protein [Stylosanthes scabra]
MLRATFRFPDVTAPEFEADQWKVGSAEDPTFFTTIFTSLAHSTTATPSNDTFSSSNLSSSAGNVPINGIETCLPPPPLSTNTHSMTTRSKLGVFKPRALAAQPLDLIHNVLTNVTQVLSCPH